jgi:hypothetical protein
MTSRYRLKAFMVALFTTGAVILLMCVKYFVNINRWDFIVFNPLITTLVGSATFILGFLLSGLIADYKESERIPSELANNIEGIWQEGLLFKRTAQDFDIDLLRTRLLSIIDRLKEDVHIKQKRSALTNTLKAVNELSESFFQMQQLGITANYLVRLKQEQSNMRRLVNRIYYIQRTQYIPSAYILVESITVIVLIAFLFIKTDAQMAEYVAYGFLAYLFIYINHLIRVIEKPFQEGANNLDDVSLFLLEETHAHLLSEHIAPAKGE